MRPHILCPWHAQFLWPSFPSSLLLVSFSLFLSLTVRLVCSFLVGASACKALHFHVDALLWAPLPCGCRVVGATALWAPCCGASALWVPCGCLVLARHLTLFVSHASSLRVSHAPLASLVALDEALIYCGLTYRDVACSTHRGGRRWP